MNIPSPAFDCQLEADCRAGVDPIPAVDPSQIAGYGVAIAGSRLVAARSIADHMTEEALVASPNLEQYRNYHKHYHHN